MVAFKCVATAALAAFAIPALAATTPDQVVQNIKGITQKSQDLQMPASQLNLVNGALVVVGQGPLPKVIFGFADIVTTAGKAFVQMQGMAPVAPGQASDAIFDSFREFVKVHQALLNILIGKAGLFTTIPFIGAPVAAVLRQIEMVVDTLANTLIDTLQGRQSEVQQQGDMLMATVEKSIQSFQGLQLSGSQTQSGSSPMMSGGSDPLSQVVGSVTGSLEGPLSGLLGGIAGPALGGGMSSSMSSSSMMPMSTGGSMMSSMNSTSGSASMTGSSSMAMPTSSMSMPSSMPSSSSSSSGSMSSGSPSGVSLSSGGLSDLLKPLSGLLSGGGSTSMPAKRAMAFQA